MIILFRAISQLPTGLISFLISLKVIVILQLTISSCASLIGRDYEEGRKQFQAGMEQVSLGNEDAALSHFKKATLHYQKLASAYYEMAKIYLERDTIADRYKADQALRKAVLFDSENVEYRMALARLNLKRNLIGSAEGEFKNVLEIDSSNAEAWHNLGMIREDEYLYYSNMVNADSSGAAIHFNPFATKDRKKSIGYYEKAISSNPDFLASYYRLGFLYYESSDWVAMVGLLQDAVERSPMDKNANLFLALAYYRLGRLEKASSSYETAWELMDEDEREFYASVLPLRSFSFELAAGPSEKREFWTQRDPLYLTDYNERLLEHFSRIAYANMRFGNPQRNIEGWTTDKGKVYIRYGPPIDKSKTGARLAEHLPYRGSTLIGSTETWYYPGFEFVFEDAFHTRNYQFKWGMGANDDYRDVFRRTVKVMPEFYLSPYERNTINIPVVARQFMKPDGATVVYLYSGLPEEYVENGASSSSVTMQKGIFLFDQDWQEISKKTDSVNLRPVSYQRPTRYITVLDSLLIEPGDYHIALEYFNPSKKMLGRYQDSLEVHDFIQSPLLISDLLLVNEIKLRTGISNVSRNQISVSPSYDYLFKPGQDIHLYYEIYNLGLDFDGLSDYTLFHTVTRKKEKTSLVKKLFGFLRRGNNEQTRVVTQYDYRGDRARENHYRILQLKDYGPGEYDLMVQVKDRNTGFEFSRNMTFRISEGRDN